MAIGSDSYQDKPGVVVKGISEIVKETVADLDIVTEAEEKAAEIFQSTLSGHIISAYQTNKAARREANMDIEMIDSLYQVNMQYRAAELAQIGEGSNIYMGITATKSRDARSWIKDLIQPANDVPFRIDKSADPELPKAITEMIEKAFAEDYKRLEAEIEDQFAKESKPPQQPQQGQDGQAIPPEAAQAEQAEGQSPPPEEEEKPQSALLAVKKLQKSSELRRNIDQTVQAEIDRIAKGDLAKLEKKVIDQLIDGQWNQALSDFIEDFTIYPTAFMKGPIVTTKMRMQWENGMATPKRVTTFMNKRVCPLDIYPSPSAATIYDGNFLEHIRLTKKELSDLTFLSADTGYKAKAIKDLLLNESPGTGGSIFLDSEIEEDKQEAEKRGSQTYASEGIYHGAHFWGTASAKMLRDWGYEEADLDTYEDHVELEIEAILINNTVIKCLINRDPLGRRPYYSASFDTRSGSIWGKSLPFLMRPDQRLCNASARALADNMGLSSGPQVSLMVDRLADDGDIEGMKPRKVWQFTSDPTGNGGKPIEFFIVPSNAQELIAVYDKFESKADDATGIPKYAHGSSQATGAGQTASGLAMLMESASKGIKASTKNISEGLIEPRVEYQFYLHLLKEMEDGNPSKFSGDINVVVYAAEAFTIKAAESQLQRELLQTISGSEQAMVVVGMEGYGEILRKIFKGANLPEDAIPTRLELKETIAKQEFSAKQTQAAQAQEAQQKGQVGLQATQLQIDGQKEMHTQTQEVKVRELDQKAEAKSIDQQIKGIEIQQRTEAEANKGITKLADTDKKITSEAQNVDRKLATDLAKSENKEI